MLRLKAEPDPISQRQAVLTGGLSVQKIAAVKLDARLCGPYLQDPAAGWIQHTRRQAIPVRENPVVVIAPAQP